ncbi:FxsA family protein [Aurantimonas sp. Leaf443]|uniref:FxsA family protein n=1 Tax=Aurantimonas sp. Leaf443 TaxID=1736378 RepID=UPI0006FC7845|nr:FxsA family protein [Aurantimonas sp. Leaf443]KQT85552.1 hypothetical protein ASG48_10095 [Aurantimonas sp. Leaf443]
MPLILIPILLLAMPLVEIGGFILVGDWLGLWPTLLLVVLSAILGAALLRRQGIATLRRMQGEMRAGRVPGREAFDAVLIGIAGMLLLVPGFVSDIFGLLLFVPAVRRMIGTALARRVVVAGSATMARRPGAPHPSGPAVIDLTAAEIGRGRDPNSPWTRDGTDDETGPRTLH